MKIEELPCQEHQCPGRAIVLIWSHRDQRVYPMCEFCATHSVDNRGMEKIDWRKRMPDTDYFMVVPDTENYRGMGGKTALITIEKHIEGKDGGYLVPRNTIDLSLKPRWEKPE